MVTANPKVVFTYEEAIKKGLNPNHPKGYYTKINGIRVPVVILDKEGKEIEHPEFWITKFKNFFRKKRLIKLSS